METNTRMATGMVTMVTAITLALIMATRKTIENTVVQAFSIVSLK